MPCVEWYTRFVALLVPLISGDVSTSNESDSLHQKGAVTPERCYKEDYL